MYSGRSTEQLKSAFPWLWDRVDLLISEPYEDTQSGECALRGSANQRVHRLSALARQRYPEDSLKKVYAVQRQQISMHVDDRSVWMVGIPKPGDMARLRRLLEDRGVTMGRTSWLS